METKGQHFRSLVQCLALGVAKAEVVRFQRTNNIRNVCDFLKTTPKEDPTRQALCKLYNKYRGLRTSSRRLDAASQDLIQRISFVISDVVPERLSSIEKSLSGEYKIRIIEYCEKVGDNSYGRFHVIWSSPCPNGIPITIMREGKDQFDFFEDIFYCLNPSCHPDQGCDQCINVSLLS